MKILIADDDTVSRRLLERTLLRAGYEVVPVVNGRQAVENPTGPDVPRLALLDWMMPELDGPGVCREIRNRRGQSGRLARRLERAPPPDELVEHRGAALREIRVVVERLAVHHHAKGWLQPDVHRASDGRHLQCDGGHPERLHRARTAAQKRTQTCA